MLKFNRFGAFPLRSVCVPLINRHMGRVNDVTHCYNPLWCLPLPSVCLPLIDMHKPMTSPRKEVSSCMLIWIRFTNERHSTTIGTIGLPRLAREVT